MTINVDPHWSRFETARIPKRAPWSVLLMMLLAMLAAISMVVGFWLAAAPR
jgi:hypothetical protein